MTEKINDMQKDALKEIGNIGSGNASSILATLIKNKVDISLTDLDLLSIDEVENQYSNEGNEPVVSAFLRVKGNLFGTIATILNKELAIKFIDLMSGKEIGTTKIVDKKCEEQFSVLGKELADAYLNALHQFLGVELKSSDTIIAINKKNVIVNFLVRGVCSSTTDSILRINTKFIIEEYGIKGEFLLFFGLESLEEFKKVINEKMGL